MDFDFDTSNGRNVFTLLVRVLDPEDEQTIIYQSQKQYSYPEGKGYVSNSFEISSFYTNVSTLMFNFKVYGYRNVMAYAENKHSLVENQANTLLQSRLMAI